jgi:hypothetical protein
MSTVNQYQISIKREADGRNFGRWKELSGWGTDSAEVFNRDEYLGPRVPLGAPSVLSTLTASKTFYVDLDDDVTALDADSGHTYYVVTRQKLLPAGGAVNSGRSRRCMLKGIKLADVNVGDDSPAVDTYTIELTPQG